MVYNISPRSGHLGHMEGCVRWMCAALTGAAITMEIEPATGLANFLKTVNMRQQLFFISHA